MSRQIQIRRGTAAEHANFTGAIGEITMDTTNKTLRVHDGQTAGGTILAKQSEIQTAPSMAEIMSAMIPDYTAGVSVVSYTSSSNQFTAPADGILSLLFASYNASGVYIDDVCVAECNGASQYERESIVLPIASGSKFYAPALTTSSRFTPMFFPFKGNSNG